MPLPALVLGEGTWSRVNATAAPPGVVAHPCPLVTVNGVIASKLPELDVSGILGSPLTGALPSVQFEAIRAALTITSTAAARAHEAAAGNLNVTNDPAAVVSLVEGHPSVIMAFVMPCAQISHAIPRVLRARGPAGSKEAPAVWSLPALLAGRHMAQGKIDSTWIMYGIGADAIVAHAQRTGTAVEFTEARVAFGCGADVIASTIAAVILEHIEEQPGLKNVLADDNPLRRHLIALARITAAQLISGCEATPGRVDRRFGLAPPGLITASGVDGQGADALKRGFSLGINTPVKSLRQRLSNQSSPMLTRALQGVSDLVVPDGADLVGAYAVAWARSAAGVRVVALPARDVFKFGEQGQPSMTGAPYFANVSGLEATMAKGGTGVLANGTTVAKPGPIPAARPQTALPLPVAPPPPVPHVAPPTPPMQPVAPPTPPVPPVASPTPPGQPVAPPTPPVRPVAPPTPPVRPVPPPTPAVQPVAPVAPPVPPVAPPTPPATQVGTIPTPPPAVIESREPNPDDTNINPEIRLRQLREQICAPGEDDAFVFRTATEYRLHAMQDRDDIHRVIHIDGKEYTTDVGAPAVVRRASDGKTLLLCFNEAPNSNTIVSICYFQGAQ